MKTAGFSSISATAAKIEALEQSGSVWASCRTTMVQRGSCAGTQPANQLFFSSTPSRNWPVCCPERGSILWIP